MITFWNRKELYMGESSTDFNKVRAVLDLAGIKYTYQYGNFGGFNSMLANQSYTPGTYQCYIYVHKKDFEKACAAIRDYR